MLKKHHFVLCPPKKTMVAIVFSLISYMKLPNGRRSFNGAWGRTQKIKSQWYCPIKICLRHSVHDWILLADAQWPASLFCTNDSAWWLQMSFNWSLTWDFPMADAHSMERGEQLKRSNLNGIVQSKFRLRHTVHYWILLADAQWPASLFCTHDSAWWLQMSFNWPLTWGFPMADAHSMEPHHSHCYSGTRSPTNFAACKQQASSKNTYSSKQQEQAEASRSRQKPSSMHSSRNNLASSASKGKQHPTGGKTSQNEVKHSYIARDSAQHKRSQQQAAGIRQQAAGSSSSRTLFSQEHPKE